jgi:hypothetical protein
MSPLHPHGEMPYEHFSTTWGAENLALNTIPSAVSTEGRKQENYSRAGSEPSNSHQRNIWPSLAWLDESFPASFVRARDWEALAGQGVGHLRAFPRASWSIKDPAAPLGGQPSSGQLLLPGILDPYFGKVMLPPREDSVVPDHSAQLALDLIKPGAAACAKANIRSRFDVNAGVATPYVDALREPGHEVVVVFDEKELLRLIAKTHYDVVVLDGFQVERKRDVIDKLLLGDGYHAPPIILWLSILYSASRPGDHFSYRHITTPRGVAQVHDLPRGDVNTLVARLRLALNLKLQDRQPEPVDIIIKHGRPIQYFDTLSTVSLREWQRRNGCGVFETVMDIELSDGRTLRDITRQTFDPVRRMDAYVFDRVAAHHYFGKPLHRTEIAETLTDPDVNVFAQQILRLRPEGFNREDVSQAFKRLSGGLDLAGLPGAKIIRRENGYIWIDRALVAVLLVHVPM